MDSGFHFGKDNRVFFLKIFENRGAQVGCSNAHPHGQLWAGNFLPSIPAKKEATQKEYFVKYGRPMLCDYFEQEATRFLGVY